MLNEIKKSISQYHILICVILLMYFRASFFWDIICRFRLTFSRFTLVKF